MQKTRLISHASSPLSAVILCAMLCSLSLLGCMTSGTPGPSAPGRPSAEFEADKKHAHDLMYMEHKHGDAIPILERLVAENPKDREAVGMLAICLATTSTALGEGSTEQRNALIRSRELAQSAKNMGSTDIMLDLILDTVPADGKLITSFSGNKTADAAIKKGEEFFAKSNWQKALEAYMAAETLDPTSYYAPLFVGDCYFVMKQPVEAGQAFARAISINPDKETAYRYWGDALMQAGRMEEATHKFI